MQALTPEEVRQMPPEFLCRKLSWLEEPFWIQEEVMLSANAPLSKRDRGAAPPKPSEAARVCVKPRASRKLRKLPIQNGHHLSYTTQMPSKLTLTGGKKGWSREPAAGHPTPPPFPSFLSNSIPQCTCLVREKQEKEERGNPI